jgi:hypothetical protein
MCDGNSTAAAVASLAALASAGAAWAALSSSRAQTRLADAKLRADLFDRRFAVFKAVSDGARKGLQLVNRERDFSLGFEVAFIDLLVAVEAEAPTAKLLFGTNVSSQVSELAEALDTTRHAKEDYVQFDRSDMMGLARVRGAYHASHADVVSRLKALSESSEGHLTLATVSVATPPLTLVGRVKAIARVIEANRRELESN